MVFRTSSQQAYILCSMLTVASAHYPTVTELPPAAAAAAQWYLSISKTAKNAEALLTSPKLSISALECSPIPSIPFVEICQNETDTCICGPGQTQCECAPAHCLGLGDYSQIGNFSIKGQSSEQEDASGVKITLQRFLSGTIIRPKRVALGDPSGCIDIEDSHWCLWITGGSGQPIIGGACVPRSCTARNQADVRRLAIVTYVSKCIAIAGCRAMLLGGDGGNMTYMDDIAAIVTLSVGSNAAGGNETYGIHCTSTERGTGWWERTGGTQQKQFSDDRGSQLSVAIICILVGGSILSSVALKAKAQFAAVANEEQESLLARVEEVRGKGSAGKPVVPFAVDTGVTRTAVDGGESSGEYHGVAQQLAGERTQATQIFGEANPVPDAAELGSEMPDNDPPVPELSTAAAIRAEISHGLRTSNTGGWASPTPSPDASPHISMQPTAHRSQLSFNWLWSLLECFDADAHWSALLKTSAQRPTSFLHGLRTWSMAWVIFGHTGFDPTIPGFDNPIEIVRKYQRSFRFVIAYGFTAVDTFFFMSGFLSTYLLVARWPKNLGYNFPKISFRLLLVYLDRYARLTPLYALVILFSRYLVQYISQGPINVLADMGSILGPCGEDWWKNLLYINTVQSDPNPVCLGHTWYLGNDMMYVWFFTPFMVLYTYGKIGGAIATVVVTMTLVTSIILATHYGGHQDDFGKAYFRPWNRAAPYLWGILAAFMLRSDMFKGVLKTVVGHPAIRFVLYLAAAAHMFGVLVWQWMKYSTVPLFANAVPMAMQVPVFSNTREDHGVAWNRGEAFFYYYGWGMGLFIITVVWGLGHGGPVTRFLGHPVFECLGRLTYGAYLTHPIVLVVMKLSTTAGALPHFNDFWLLSNWTAATVGAFILAAVFFVFVERPAGALWELATQQKKRK